MKFEIVTIVDLKWWDIVSWRVPTSYFSRTENMRHVDDHE